MDDYGNLKIIQCKGEMNMKVTLVEEFKPFKMGDYTVTPLPDAICQVIMR